jgi:hypothetical protein
LTNKGRTPATQGTPQAGKWTIQKQRNCPGFTAVEASATILTVTRERVTLS